MNKVKLINTCHKIKEKTNLSFNSIIAHYFLEKILEKISKSIYGMNFIFKGGFVLSNFVGITSRTTSDIDFLLYGIEFTRENVLGILETVLYKNNDEITYKIISIEEIKELDRYSGYRVKILCKLENIRQVIPLDIAIGDVVTPNPISYNYKTIFLDKEINIKAYTIETMIAEKIETIYKKNIFNTRSKDFYDIYIYYIKLGKKILI
ncbi:nucleotidyl transferase AbiEii/AbiGii toxin family protein [Oceanivirga salmonicida]|uniref:nucleotidyl transferase AbiEii/AbiGii toxin family protein n=1 Tax=Oceanivirga salmonicida TaxID=1769291 RepID=UPI0018D21C82|nr:nucleotidyl transferase AbiEii/AbiGii toxin family protein [Oceanivirga salmonicida]